MLQPRSEPQAPEQQQPSLPFVDLAAQQQRIRAGILARFADVLDHGQYVNGPEVIALEHALQTRSGAAHAITCSSGTDALLLSLLSLGIGPGDRVVVPAFTFVAPAEAVALLGAIPVFVDVDADYFTLCVPSLRRALEAYRGIKAVIAVDLFGLPSDTPALRAVLTDAEVPLIADAAQAFGGSSAHGRVGELALLTCTSFFPAKPLGAYGDGGAVFTNDSALAERLRSIREHGFGSGRYQHVRLGLTARLATLQAAVLLEKLTIFDDELQRRAQVAAHYTRLLAPIAGISLPEVPAGYVSSWAQYTVKLSRAPLRTRLREALRQRGIPTMVYYPHALVSQEAYASYPVAPGGVPVSLSLAQSVLSLPIHPYIQRAEQEWIVEAIAQCLYDCPPEDLAEDLAADQHP